MSIVPPTPRSKAYAFFGVTNLSSARPTSDATRLIGFAPPTPPSPPPVCGQASAGGSRRNFTSGGWPGSYFTRCQSWGKDSSGMQTTAGAASVTAGSVVILTQWPCTTIFVISCEHPDGVPPSCVDTSSTVTTAGTPWTFHLPLTSPWKVTQWLPSFVFTVTMVPVGIVGGTTCAAQLDVLMQVSFAMWKRIGSSVAETSGACVPSPRVRAQRP